MTVRCTAARWVEGLFPAIILVVIMIMLAATGMPQAERATSRIKKPLIYQFGNVVHIDAEGPRPLLRALDALQDKYGWMVDYEDPRYPADSVVNDRASGLRRRHPNIGVGIGNFERERFSVQFNTGPTPDGRPDEAFVLTTVVAAYNQSEGLAEFELRQEHGGRFSVVGIGVRGTDNEITIRQPILDLPITVAVERRSAEKTIELICQKVSEQGKIPVAIPVGRGGLAENLLPENKLYEKVAVGGTGVPARTLLLGALPSTGNKLPELQALVSWRLLYDAGERSYALSLNSRAQPASSR